MAKPIKRNLPRPPPLDDNKVGGTDQHNSPFRPIYIPPGMPYFGPPPDPPKHPYTSPTEGYEPPSKPGEPPPEIDIKRPTDVDQIYEDIFGDEEPPSPPSIKKPGEAPSIIPPGTTITPEPPPTTPPGGPFDDIPITPPGPPSITGPGAQPPAGREDGRTPAGTDPADPFNMTSWLNDWQDYAINAGSIGQLMNQITVQIPGVSEGMAIYGDILNELQELIRTKGEVGLMGTYEEQYGEAAGRVSRAAKGSRMKMLGDLARRGIVQSGVAGELLGGIQAELESSLVNLSINLMRERSDKAAVFYTQARSEKLKLGELWTESGYKGYDMALRLAALTDDSKRAWAEMGLHEKLTMAGYDVEIYKADIQADISRQRLALEEKLGFADINIREMMVENEWDMGKMKLALQEKLADKGIEQQELDRALNEWDMLMRNEISSRRTDIDLLNVMGTLSNQEWELQIRQAELELKSWMGQEQLDIMRDQMGMDWQMFIEDKAMQRWIAEGSWASAEEIARTYARAQKGGDSWFGDLMSFFGDAGKSAAQIWGGGQ